VNYVGNSYYLPSDKGYERILWKLRGHECVERLRTTALESRKSPSFDFTKSGHFLFEFCWGWCHEWVGVNGVLDDVIETREKIQRVFPLFFFLKK